MSLLPYLLCDVLIDRPVVGPAELVHLLEVLGVVAVEELQAAHRVADGRVVVADPAGKENKNVNVRWK